MLAVAGATSLVTLLLAVPITVLAVLALVPQDQARRVSGCSRRQRAAHSWKFIDLWLCFCLPGSAGSPPGHVCSVSAALHAVLP